MDAFAGKDADNNIGLQIRWMAKKRAFKLATSPGFRYADRADYEHVLETKAHQALERFDPNRGSLWGFLSRVLDNEVRNIVKFARRQCRHPFRVQSINQPLLLPDKTLVELSNILEDSDVRRHRNLNPFNQFERFERVFDVRSVLLSCPPELRELGEALKVASLAQVARERGVPRTTLHHLKRRLKKRLIHAGLGRDNTKPRRKQPLRSSPPVESVGKPLRRFRKCDF